MKSKNLKNLEGLKSDLFSDSKLNKNARGGTVPRHSGVETYLYKSSIQIDLDGNVDRLGG